MNQLIADTLATSLLDKSDVTLPVTPSKLLFDIEVIELDDQSFDANSNVVFYRSTCTTCSTS